MPVALYSRIHILQALLFRVANTLRLLLSCGNCYIVDSQRCLSETTLSRPYFWIQCLCDFEILERDTTEISLVPWTGQNISFTYPTLILHKIINVLYTWGRITCQTYSSSKIRFRINRKSMCRKNPTNLEKRKEGLQNLLFLNIRNFALVPKSLTKLIDLFRFFFSLLSIVICPILENVSFKMLSIIEFSPANTEFQIREVTFMLNLWDVF